jgi:cytochrome c-type biogenesis protein CcmE
MKPRAKRAMAVVLALVALGIASTLVLRAFQSNLVFFFSPTQVVAKEAPDERSFRIGGLVEQGSIAARRQSLTVRFAVTDTGAQDSGHLHRPVARPVQGRQGRGGQGKLGPDGVFHARPGAGQAR